MKKIYTLFFIFCFLYSSTIWAEKSIKLQTYYPAPQGSYKNFRSHNVCIGGQCFDNFQERKIDNGLFVQNRVFIGDGSQDLGNNYKLYVGGALKVTNEIEGKDFQGNTFTGGTFSGSSFLYTSDQQLKERIIELEDSLQKVLALRGVSFYFKDNPNVKRIGLIAQEVETIVPEVVVTGDNGIKSIEYGNLIALLIEAIKQQQEVINQQQKEIDILKSKLQ